MTMMQSQPRIPEPSFEERSKQLGQEQENVGAASGLKISAESHVKKLKRFVGVRQRPSGRWVAEIKGTTQKIRRWLGTFDTAEDAARAYDRAARSLRGTNTRTNFGERPAADHNSFNFPASSLLQSMTAAAKTLHYRQETNVMMDGKRRCISQASFLRSEREHLHEKKMPSLIKSKTSMVEPDSAYSRGHLAASNSMLLRCFEFPYQTAPKTDVQLYSPFARCEEFNAMIRQGARSTEGCQSTVLTTSDHDHAQAEVLLEFQQQNTTTERRQVETSAIFGTKVADPGSMQLSSTDACFTSRTAIDSDHEKICPRENCEVKALQYCWARNGDKSRSRITTCNTPCGKSSESMSDLASSSFAETAVDLLVDSAEKVSCSSSKPNADPDGTDGWRNPFNALLDSSLPSITGAMHAPLDDNVHDESIKSQRFDAGISSLVSGLRGVQSEFIQGFLFL